jgi:integrase/recombinase XerD
MKVTLRKRALSNGMQSLFLDIYDGVNNRQRENLKLYLHTKPRGELEREHNKQTKELAERIRTSREIQLNEEDHGLRDKAKRKTNLLEYWQNYIDTYQKKDIKPVAASLKYFKEFVGGKTRMLPGEVTEQMCINFRAYLDGKLNGETPHDYFAKFKKMLRQATREGLFLKNPAADVQNPKPEGIKKDILTLEEIKALAGAECGNDHVRKAFLFACFTGLRWVDIVALKWGQIHNSEDGLQVHVKQAKTEVDVKINLNKTAAKLIGERGGNDDSIFSLPSHTGMLKVLRVWGKRAKISKKITFHVGRHSFATNLILHETDIYTVSNLLGHSSLQHTAKYARVAKQLKEQAVNKLEIDL